MINPVTEETLIETFGQEAFNNTQWSAITSFSNTKFYKQDVYNQDIMTEASRILEHQMIRTITNNNLSTFNTVAGKIFQPDYRAPENGNTCAAIGWVIKGLESDSNNHEPKTIYYYDFILMSDFKD